MTEDEKILRDMRASLSREYIAEMFEALGALGMSRDEIISEVENYQ